MPSSASECKQPNEENQMPTDTEMMTAEEFIAYWTAPFDPEGDGPYDMMSALDAAEESLMEHETQYRSECAMFGDAGPGQGIHVRDLRSELANIKARLRYLGYHV
jgi:hypothetical protein